MHTKRDHTHFALVKTAVVFVNNNERQLFNVQGPYLPYTWS